MLIRISKTAIFNTNTIYNYKLDDSGQLQISNEYQYLNYSFEESMLIWKQLLEQIVYQHGKYLSVLNDSETSRKLIKEFNEQIFGEFNQLEQQFRQIQDEIEREYKEKQRLELLDEGINIEDIEF